MNFLLINLTYTLTRNFAKPLRVDILHLVTTKEYEAALEANSARFHSIETSLHLVQSIRSLFFSRVLISPKTPGF